MIGLLQPRHWRKGRRRKLLKSEYRNKFKIGPADSPPCGRVPSFEFQMFKTKTEGLTRSTFGFGHLDFGNSDLFRISNLLVPKAKNIHGDRMISEANE